VPKKQGSVSLVPVARELSEDDLSVIVDTARRRAEPVAQMRKALLDGDDDLALKLARQVAGLERAA
jgi:hypothetical protein